jgi:DNA-binding CsgD family transcriptional regulator
MLKVALESVPAAVFFVAADGKIVSANEAATEMLRSKQGLTVRRGALGAIDPCADKLLREALAAAARGDSALGLKGIDIPLTDAHGNDYLANVLSIVSEGRRVADAGMAVAVLFVRRITLASQTPLEAAARRYGLTPSELRVLAAVLEAGSIADIAERLGISKATVKTHLNHLMAKTGAQRQTDLMRLFLGGMS